MGRVSLLDYFRGRAVGVRSGESSRDRSHLSISYGLLSPISAIVVQKPLYSSNISIFPITECILQSQQNQPCLDIPELIRQLQNLTSTAITSRTLYLHENVTRYSRILSAYDTSCVQNVTGKAVQFIICFMTALEVWRHRLVMRRRGNDAIGILERRIW